MYFMNAIKYIVAVLMLSHIASAGAQTNSYSNASIDLSVDETITVGDLVTFTIKVSNTQSPTYLFQEVATNPVVTVQMPVGSRDYSSADCVQVSELALQCELPEIGIDESTTVSLVAVLNDAGYQLVTAIIDADNLLGGPETDSQLLTVQPQTEVTDPVDLAVEVSASSDNEIKEYGVETITATIKNLHPVNTAIFPVVALELSPGLEFYTGDYCSVLDKTVSCSLPTLPPQTETAFVFAVSAASQGQEAEVSIVAGSSQAELLADDNKAFLSFDIVVGEALLCGASNPVLIGCEESTESTGNDANQQEQEEPMQAAGNSTSGGGVLSLLMLHGLLLGWCWCGFYRRLFYSKKTSSM